MYDEATSLKIVIDSYQHELNASSPTLFYFGRVPKSGFSLALIVLAFGLKSLRIDRIIIGRAKVLKSER